MAVDVVTQSQSDAQYWEQRKEEAVDRATTSTSTDDNGNSYTTAVSNDTLTNNDFLKLLLEEMKMQDPTKPKDTQAIMDSQLKMSQIQANEEMSSSLKALTASYAASSLSNAVGFMGKVIENGSSDEELGVLNSYKVATVESIDGEVYVNAHVQTGYYHNVRISSEVDGETVYTDLSYNSDGKILDENGADTGVNAVLLDNGSFQIIDEKYVFNDNDGNIITDENILNKYEITSALPQYSSSFTTIPVNSITKVHG